MPSLMPSALPNRAKAVLAGCRGQALVLVQNEAETPPCSSWQALCEVIHSAKVQVLLKFIDSWPSNKLI